MTRIGGGCARSMGDPARAAIGGRGDPAARPRPGARRGARGDPRRRRQLPGRAGDRREISGDGARAVHPRQRVRRCCPVGGCAAAARRPPRDRDHVHRRLRRAGRRPGRRCPAGTRRAGRCPRRCLCRGLPDRVSRHRDGRGSPRGPDHGGARRRRGSGAGQRRCRHGTRDPGSGGGLLRRPGRAGLLPRGNRRYRLQHRGPETAGWGANRRPGRRYRHRPGRRPLRRARVARAGLGRTVCLRRLRRRHHPLHNA